MIDLTSLKIEAAKLLDELNQYYYTAANGRGMSNSDYYFEKKSEEYSFKDRLKKLKQKIYMASSQGADIL